MKRPHDDEDEDEDEDEDRIIIAFQVERIFVKDILNGIVIGQYCYLQVELPKQFSLKWYTLGKYL